MAICFKDRSYCASPNCTNACGRMMTDEEHEEYIRVNAPDQQDGMLGIMYGYYCGEPSEPDRGTQQVEKGI